MDADRLKEKKDAFKWAMSYAIGQAKHHEIETYRIATEERTIFTQGPQAVYTPANQTVEIAITIADWLLQEE